MKIKDLFTEEYDANARPYWSFDRTPLTPVIKRRLRKWIRRLGSFVGWATLWAVGLFAFAMFCWWGVGGSIRNYQHSQDEQACRVFQEETGHKTRFVNYNFWTWDCLTPGFNGKWVSDKSPSLYQPNSTDLNLKNVK
jgi:hypothetical protein